MNTMEVMQKYGLDPILMQVNPQEFVNKIVTTLEDIRRQIESAKVRERSPSISKYKSSANITSEQTSVDVENFAHFLAQLITQTHHYNIHTLVGIKEVLQGAVKTIDNIIETHDTLDKPIVENVPAPKGEKAQEFRNLLALYKTIQAVIAYQAPKTIFPEVRALGNIGGESTENGEWTKKNLQSRPSGWKYVEIDFGEGDGYQHYNWYDVAYWIDLPIFYPKFDYQSWIETFENYIEHRLGVTPFEIELSTTWKVRYDPK